MQFNTIGILNWQSLRWWHIRAMTSQTTVKSHICSTAYSGNHQRKNQRSVLVVSSHDDVIKWKHFPRYWPFTETEMSSFWRNLHHWLHRKLSNWQLSVQPVMKISSKWLHFRFSVCAGNSPVSGEFPVQRPVTRSFDVFFDLHLIKLLSKHSLGWWFQTLSCQLWRHRNDEWNPTVTSD